MEDLVLNMVSTGASRKSAPKRRTLSKHGKNKVKRLARKAEHKPVGESTTGTQSTHQQKQQQPASANASKRPLVSSTQVNSVKSVHSDKGNKDKKETAVKTDALSDGKKGESTSGDKRVHKDKIRHTGGGSSRQISTTLFDPHTVAQSQTIGDKEDVSRQQAKAKSTHATVFTAETPEELPIDERLARYVSTEMNIAKLTLVQQRAIPLLLRRRDLLVHSPTGTGKTLAYAIPVVHDLSQLSPKVKRSDGPYAIVLLPTRELALQSLEVFQKLLRPSVWIVAGAVMGGERKKAEKARIRKGLNILVATPGRFLDHIQTTNCLGLARVRWLILDEADRLLEKGFEEALSTAIKRMDQWRRPNDRNAGRTNVLLSATLTDDVEQLAKLSLKSPETIKVSAADADAVASEPHEGVDTSGDPEVESDAGDGAVASEQFAFSERLCQYHVKVPCKLRLVAVLAFLKWKCEPDPTAKTIVFFASRDMITFYDQLLCALGSPKVVVDASGKISQDTAPARTDDGPPILGDLPLYFLHGGLSQAERTSVFMEYCKTKRGVLFSTDVASRGLHLPRVKWIVQATAPASTSEYVHRVGRTARLDTKGNAVIFLMPSEVPYLDELKKHGVKTLMEMSLSDIITTLPGLVRKGQEGRLTQATKDACNALQHRCEQAVMHDEALLATARSAYKSYVRAYTTYPSALKHIFHIRALHLGHVAKSFALRDAPTDVLGSSEGKSGAAGRRGKSARKADAAKKDRTAQRQRTKRVSAALKDEFGGSGLTAGPKTKKRRKTGK